MLGKRIGLVSAAVLLGSTASAWAQTAPVSAVSTGPGLVEGYSSAAFIDQVGSGNAAEQTQSVGPGNLARISQTGNDNGAVLGVSQSQGGSYNEAEIIQPGDRNAAHQIQGGVNSYASTTQYGNDNFATILQGLVGSHSAIQVQNGDGNFSLVDQLGGGSDGHGNTATVTQEWADHGEIYQNGRDNVADQVQQGDPMFFDGFSVANQGLIEQTGDGNTTTQIQVFANDGSVSIIGDENTVSQTQDSTSFGGSIYNFADINIAGDENAVVQEQEGGNFLGLVDITGEENVVWQMQGGVNLGEVWVLGGEKNMATQVQTVSNFALIEQHGKENEAVQYQNGYNTADIYQLADDGRAFQDQSGLGQNYSLITQATDGHYAYASQHSDAGNASYQFQQGHMGDFSYVHQAGGGNFSTVNQL